MSQAPLRRTGLFFKTQLLIFLGEHYTKPHPLLGALILDSLACDNPVLANSQSPNTETSRFPCSSRT